MYTRIFAGGHTISELKAQPSQQMQPLDRPMTVIVGICRDPLWAEESLNREE